MTRFAAILCLLAVPVWAGDLKVIDGDTLVLDGERIELHGIDAPELDQTCARQSGELFECGLEAKAVLEWLTRGPPELDCKALDGDRHGGTVAVCTIENIDVGEQMVRRGWALADWQHSYEYARAGQLAKDRKLGLWAGEFVAPSEWRQSRGQTP